MPYLDTRASLAACCRIAPTFGASRIPMSPATIGIFTV
jgi:hypothetical protein